jgi:hypothetical protein
VQPKFKNIQEYEKAQLLMQPIFIRVVDNIRKESELRNLVTSYEEINEPFLSYILSIKKGENIIKYNLWDLCFQVCFQDYQINQIEPVKIDINLINDQGEVDWEMLENKTKKLIASVFNLEK